MKVGSLIETTNEYKLAEMALNEYIYNGDMSLLEVYAEGDIGFLLEATDEEERLGLSKREIKRRRKVELIPQELVRRKIFSHEYNPRSRYGDLEDNSYPNLDPESLKYKSYEKNKDYGHQSGINYSNKDNIQDLNRRRYGSNVIINQHINSSGSNLRNLKQKGIPVNNYKQIHKVLGNSDGTADLVSWGNLIRLDSLNKELKEKGYKPVTIKDIQSPNFILHKDAPNQSSEEQPKPETKPEVKPQQSPSQPKESKPLSQQEKAETMKKMQQTTKNILNTSEDKPKSVLARMVASLQNLYRKWLDIKNQAKANGEDVGFFSNILRVILNCIDKLTWKIRNWSDGRKSNHYNSK